MNSRRLPGKPMRLIAGKPMLYHHLSRIRRARLIDQLVLATTFNPVDDPIVDYCRTLDIGVFRGAERNVLDRFARCAAVYDADIVVRVTADCPLIDPVLADAVIAKFLSEGRGHAYTSLDVSQFPRGFDIEVVSISALIAAFRGARLATHKEHVTSFIYGDGRRFPISSYTMEKSTLGCRLCVDEESDFDLVSRILAHFLPENPFFGWRDCLSLLERRPDWASINRHVVQLR